MKLKALFIRENKDELLKTPNTLSISPEVLKGIIVGILLLIALVHIGFSKTYIRFFPKFHGFKAVQHFHGMMMMSWLLMLLVQPILILKGKIKLHRQVGTLSYLLAPLILLSIYLVIQTRYQLYLEQGRPTNAIIAWLSLNFRIMVFFAVLFLLAMYYRHRPALHMRYMCSTAILLISPWLVRAILSYSEVGLIKSHSIDRNVNVLLAGAIALSDTWRTKRFSPFMLVFAFMTLQKILWDLRDTSFLQAVGNVLTKLF